MERKALLLFSHQLTENQEKELVENFKVKKIVSLSSELQEMWSNVSIKENYKENLEKIKSQLDRFIGFRGCGVHGKITGFRLCTLD